MLPTLSLSHPCIGMKMAFTVYSDVFRTWAVYNIMYLYFVSILKTSLLVGDFRVLRALLSSSCRGPFVPSQYGAFGPILWGERIWSKGRSGGGGKGGSDDAAKGNGKTNIIRSLYVCPWTVFRHTIWDIWFQKYICTCTWKSLQLDLEKGFWKNNFKIKKRVANYFVGQNYYQF